MSAFIVTNQTIDAVVDGIIRVQKEWGSTPLGFSMGPVLVSTWRDYDKLGQALWDMNVDAVDARYNEKNEREKYRHSHADVGAIVELKQMQCFLYQCAEGDVPETELYKAVKEYERRLASQIISNMAEWKQAPWGMEERKVERISLMRLV